MDVRVSMHIILMLSIAPLPCCLIMSILLKIGDRGDRAWGQGYDIWFSNKALVYIIYVADNNLVIGMISL